jgi:CHAT domain-containing protein
VQRIYGIAERGASVASTEESVDMAELIWKPIAEHIGEASKVYYAPSGLLHRLNLNAIQIDDFTTVADEVELVQLGSTGDLLEENLTLERPIQVALFGGLEYTEMASKEKETETTTAMNEEEAELNTFASRGSWGSLPYTMREVETIGSILEETQINYTLLSGDAGTEESFLKLVKENKNLDVLHFATHGYFFERDTTSLNLFMRSPNPLFRSGLILSNANQAWVEGHFEEEQEDGVLTAYEIAQLDLRGTELVVLSACETGLGDISNSEGVYGLQRAFKLAGVDYIIMTLWRVPDKQSKIMMEKFYTNWLEEGQEIPLAFRNAQTEMRELFDTYEWGGFVLVR